MSKSTESKEPASPAATKASEKKSKPNTSDRTPDDGESSNSHFRISAVVVRELKELYTTRLLAIEKKYLFNKLCGYPEILESELEAKPTVLLVGQYSTGKTSLIKNLLGMDYPEIHIGPEPTTDRFVAVVHGKETKTIKGNALTGVADLPFAGLSVFGAGFLNKFGAAVVPAPLLKGNII
jgi:EH domain-containing protein 1